MVVLPEPVTPVITIIMSDSMVASEDGLTQFELRRVPAGQQEIELSSETCRSHQPRVYEYKRGGDSTMVENER